MRGRMLAGIGDVALDRRSTDARGDLLQRLDPTPEQRDLRPGSVECLGGGSSDTGASAGNQGVASIERFVGLHRSPLSKSALAEPQGGGKAAAMKLAILETGRPPGELAEEFGDYPAMFRAMLGPGFEVGELRRAGR